MKALSANPIFKRAIKISNDTSKMFYVHVYYLNGKWAVGQFIGPLLCLGQQYPLYLCLQLQPKSTITCESLREFFAAVNGK